MIATECFKKFGKIDLLILIILSLSCSFLIWLIDKMPHFLFYLILNVFVIAFFMSFAALLLEKSFSAILFYFLVALFTYNTPSLAFVGMYKLMIFLYAGLIFEIFFLIFKFEIQSVPADVIFGAAVANASIPAIFHILQSFSIPVPASYSLLNLGFLFFFVAMASSTSSFILVYMLKPTKFFIKMKSIQLTQEQ